MSLRTAVLVLALCLAAAPGCGLVYGVGKFTGLMAPPEFVVREQMPEDFKLSVDVHDAADPPTDYTLTFERSGKVAYDVTVRMPRRKHVQGTYEIGDDQVKSLWKAVAAARFDKLDDRFPSDGDGSDKKNGVQKYYVFADGVERRVESHFQKNQELESIRAAAVGIVPKETMTASGAPGQPKDRPKEFIGDTLTKLLHVPDCPKLKDLPADKRQPFGSAYDAFNFGYQPCPECQPEKTR